LKKRGAGAYRYGFNGKEKDDEVKNKEGTQLDYGMRIYDTRLGRFLSVDPLQREYPELTPYQFSSNRPIDGIDRDGLEWELSTVQHDLNNRVKLDNQVAFNSRSTIGPATKSNPTASVKIHNYYSNPTIKRFTLHPGYAGGYLLYNVFNDAKIVGSSFINGGRNATDMIGNRTNEKQRVGAFVNVATTIGAPLLEAEVTAAKIASSEAQLLRNEALSIVSPKLNAGKQLSQHVIGGNQSFGKGVFNSTEDSQKVLDAFIKGEGSVTQTITKKGGERVIFEYTGETGFHNQKGELIPTNTFLLKGFGKDGATVTPVKPGKQF